MSTSSPFDNGCDSYVAFLQHATNAPVALIEAFVKEAANVRDYDAMRAFIAWRRNPRVSSLIEMAMAINTDDLDQLVFQAEDYYSNALKKRIEGPPAADA